MNVEPKPAKNQQPSRSIPESNGNNVSDPGTKKKADFSALLNAFAIIMAAVIGGIFLYYINEINNTPEQSTLEIDSIHANGDSLDIFVRNMGKTDVIIHSILIKVLADYGPSNFTVSTINLGYLNFTAIYEMPISDLAVDKSRSLDISQRVEANKADRFTINLHTNRKLKLKVGLIYNKDRIIFNETIIDPEMNYVRVKSLAHIEVELESVAVPRLAD